MDDDVMYCRTIGSARVLDPERQSFVHAHYNMVLCTVAHMHTHTLSPKDILTHTDTHTAYDPPP